MGCVAAFLGLAPVELPRVTVLPEAQMNQRMGRAFSSAYLPARRTILLREGWTGQELAHEMARYLHSVSGRQPVNRSGLAQTGGRRVNRFSPAYAVNVEAHDAGVVCG